jgi:hypothetical protein
MSAILAIAYIGIGILGLACIGTLAAIIALLIDLFGRK